MVLLKSDETEFECPDCGKHRDATRWSFPTEAGDPRNIYFTPLLKPQSD